MSETPPTMEEIEQAIGLYVNEKDSPVIYSNARRFLANAAPYLLAEARAAAKMREVIEVVRVGLRTAVDIVLDGSWSPEDIADVIGDYADELTKVAPKGDIES